MTLCSLTSREGPWLLTCCLPAGHDGDCWCTDVQTIKEDHHCHVQRWIGEGK